jgi:hypothetical protein
MGDRRTAGPHRVHFGVMCSENFEEILLLGANGYGFGCLKILRM